MLTGSQGKTNILVFDLNFHLKNDKSFKEKSYSTNCKLMLV